VGPGAGGGWAGRTAPVRARAMGAGSLGCSAEWPEPRREKNGLPFLFIYFLSIFFSFYICSHIYIYLSILDHIQII
jgi:hypothetical protein